MPRCEVHLVAHDAAAIDVGGWFYEDGEPSVGDVITVTALTMPPGTQPGEQTRARVISVDAQKLIVAASEAAPDEA